MLHLLTEKNILGIETNFKKKLCFKHICLLTKHNDETISRVTCGKILKMATSINLHNTKNYGPSVNFAKLVINSEPPRRCSLFLWIFRLPRSTGTL